MSHDKHQGFYDLLAAEWDLMVTAEDLERLLHLVDNLEVRKDMDILDLGCGTGILFDMLIRKVGENGSVTGVDFSIEMAQKARRNFPFANINVVDADVIMLPFEDSSFDMAVAFSAFPHFSNQQMVIDETHRILRSKSKFYIIHLASSRELSRLHHEIGGVVEHDAIPPEEKMRKMLDNGKFTDVIIDDQPGRYLASAVNSK
jgi:ubiquinone/menaquinone biosynthesis C-methylase UbiE